MNLELNLRFPDPTQVIVRLDDDGEHDESTALPFRGPLTESDQQDLQWYLEVYAAQYAADVDDDRAQRIAAKLPGWGAALLAAVLGNDAKARRLFDRFLDRREPGRLLTVSSDHPAVLAQPWELLRDPAGTYLVHENPRISVRRRLPKTGGGRTPLQVNPKDRLRLLFVVSRPKEAVAQRELPNLLHAVDGALQAGDEGAVEFVTNVNRFLNVFGLQRERAALTRRAEQTVGTVVSPYWFLARTNRGEQLFSAGRYREAQAVYEGQHLPVDRCLSLRQRTWFHPLCGNACRLRPDRRTCYLNRVVSNDY